MFRGANRVFFAYPSVVAAAVVTATAFRGGDSDDRSEFKKSWTPWTLPISRCEPCAVSDVVIVGGGIAGTTLAMFLTSGGEEFRFLESDLKSNDLISGGRRNRKGLKVTLLERQTVASEATGLSAGTLYTTGPPKGSLPPEASSIPTFRHISSLLYQHLQSLDDIEYTKCGCVQLATTKEELSFAKDSYEKEAKSVSKPENVKFLKSLQEVRTILPEAGPSVLGAVYTPNSGQVNAGLAAHKCAEIAEERGAVIKENVTVKKITKVNDFYAVESSNGEVFKAKVVVVAAGAWANDVLNDENKVDVYKVKGQMGSSGMEAKQGDFSKMPVVYWFESYKDWKKNHTIPHHMTHDKDVRRVTRHAYGKRSPDGILYFGGDRFFPLHEADYEVNSQLLEELFKAKIYPSLPSLSKFFSHDESGSWAGIMPFSKDGRPTIDCLDKQGLFVATGFGASGIMDSPGAMWFLADWLKGNPKSKLLDRFSKR